MRWRWCLKWTATVLCGFLALIMAKAAVDGCIHLAGDLNLGPAQLQVDIDGRTLYIWQAAPSATLFPAEGSATPNSNPGFRMGGAEWLVASHDPITDLRMFRLPLPAITTTNVPTEHFWLLSYATCPAGWMVEVYLRPILSVLAAATLALWVPWRRKRPGTCPECGNLLAGTVAGVCPECGKWQKLE